jgi:hypothetical protein
MGTAAAQFPLKEYINSATPVKEVAKISCIKKPEKKIMN